MQHFCRCVSILVLTCRVELASILLAGACLFAATTAARAADVALGARVSFNAGWRFQKGDPPGVGDVLTYGRIKSWITATGNDLLNPMAAMPARPMGNPGGEITYAQPGFDDGSWRKLNLPHDWGIEGPFKQELPGDTGKLPWSGVGWYRKHFAAEPPDAGQRLYEIVGHTLRALEELRGTCAGLPVELVVGAGESIIQWLLLPRLPGLAEAHPRLAVTFHNLKTDEILRHVLDGGIDFGVVSRCEPHRALSIAPLGKLEFCLFAPADLLPANPKLRV